MKKTKIVASIGPSSYDPVVFERMVRAGVNVARINFSHATAEEKVKAVETVKIVRERTKKNVAIMYDTKGPELRSGDTQEGGIHLIEGNAINIVKEQVEGTEEHFSVNHPHIIDKLSIGDTVLLENGLMQLEVVDVNHNAARCIIRIGGVLESKKSMSVPGVNLNIPFLSDVDLQDIIYACQHEGDFLACSFVNSAADIMVVRSVLSAQGRSDMRVIAKIESQMGMDNLEAIAQVSDGIMVARGDLGVEVPMEDLPIYQKRIISACRRHRKVSIVATEMLESMKHSIRPTRAEVTDVANAVFSGTDAVMLSGETTTGEYPAEAVEFMAKICENTELSHTFRNTFSKTDSPNTIAESMCNSVASTANELAAKVILVPTRTGTSARLISNLEPSCPILAFTNSDQLSRSLALNYGVYARTVESPSVDEVLHQSFDMAQELLNLNPGDIVITTGGFHSNPHDGQTNFLKVDRIGQGY